MNGWNALPNGLMLREDEFSWQGAISSGGRFYLRRDKSDPSKITDFLFGALDDRQIARVFAEFIKQTGGLLSERLAFTAIARLDAGRDEVISKYDRIRAIVGHSAEILGLSISDSFLETSGREYLAIVVFSLP
ncbi:hypothetical protein [Celeribacter halophilus]|uniref:hypothetical protein n=1 Tax=Celeribacter halophilus TaxID=576117 RepID=UPI001C0A1244|nr:hypothetical protein [Celeribacter halophilus]MBU2888210.1 hypothetical protein [Celeribacter halophilus]MDO6512462.1 hypothetical protein [Celeribacter halophilus]